jgi:hypothetical protein
MNQALNPDKPWIETTAHGEELRPVIDEWSQLGMKPLVLKTVCRRRSTDKTTDSKTAGTYTVSRTAGKTALAAILAGHKYVKKTQIVFGRPIDSPHDINCGQTTHAANSTMPQRDCAPLETYTMTELASDAEVEPSFLEMLQTLNAIR